MKGATVQHDIGHVFLHHANERVTNVAVVDFAGHAARQSDSSFNPAPPASTMVTLSLSGAFNSF